MYGEHGFDFAPEHALGRLLGTKFPKLSTERESCTMLAGVGDGLVFLVLAVLPFAFLAQRTKRVRAAS